MCPEELKIIMTDCANASFIVQGGSYSLSAKLYAIIADRARFMGHPVVAIIAPKNPDQSTNLVFALCITGLLCVALDFLVVGRGGPRVVRGGGPRVGGRDGPRHAPLTAQVPGAQGASLKILFMFILRYFGYMQSFL